MPRPGSAFALVALGLVGCEGRLPGKSVFESDWTPPDAFWAYEGPARVLVAEADSSFEIGSYGVFDPDLFSWVAEGAQAHADAVAACAGPWLLLVNRLQGDNLQFIDPVSGETVNQWSTGNGTNPQSAVFWGPHAFITLYEASYLLVADWRTGREAARVDLSPWSDADGIPEASRLFVEGERLWVVLENMDRATWTPSGASLLLALDPASLEVVETLSLPADNPAGGDWSLEASMAWGAAVGRYFDESGTGLALDGGLLGVDLSTGHAEIVLSEETLGRNVISALVRDGRAWLSTWDASWVNHLELWDLEDGRILEFGEGFFPGWSAGSGADLWVADAEGAGVLRVDRIEGREMGRARTLLRPASVAWCGGD